MSSIEYNLLPLKSQLKFSLRTEPSNKIEEFLEKKYSAYKSLVEAKRPKKLGKLTDTKVNLKGPKKPKKPKPTKGKLSLSSEDFDEILKLTENL